MVAEVVQRDGTIDTRTFPGSTMPFGFHRFIDKVLCIVWAIWLVAGPNIEEMRFYLSKVRSITTDLGLELNLCRAPDILPVFMAWVRGETLEEFYNTVDPCSRLFPRAMRIGGVSHILGAIMKTGACSYQKWPQWLTWIRNLVKWFRNEEHRAHVLWVLGSPHRKVLSSFSCNLAHWRFNTMWDVLSVLLKYRNICVHHMTAVDWSHSKEKDVLAECLKACADVQFWIFLQVFYTFIIDPLEKARRWSLKCPCHDDRRGGTRKPRCPQSSRRLKEARTFFNNLADKFSLYGTRNGITREQCEGDRAVWEWTRFSCTTIASKLRLKFGCYNDIPYRFSEAADQVQATECLRQVDATPWEDLDPLSQDIVERCRPCLEARSRGEPMDEVLATETAALNNNTLSELKGEGYHRGTNLTKQKGTELQSDLD